MGTGEIVRWFMTHTAATRSSTLPHSHCAALPFCTSTDMQAELSCEYNFTADSRTRAGRALGRCHAALGQHTLSVAAAHKSALGENALMLAAGHGKMKMVEK